MRNGRKLIKKKRRRKTSREKRKEWKT